MSERADLAADMAWAIMQQAGLKGADWPAAKAFIAGRWPNASAGDVREACVIATALDFLHPQGRRADG